SSGSYRTPSPWRSSRANSRTATRSWPTEKRAPRTSSSGERPLRRSSLDTGLRAGLTYDRARGTLPHGRGSPVFRSRHMRRRFVSTARWLALPALALLLAACTTRTERIAATPADAGVAPVLTVERFLRAVNARDYETMARLFGNKEGPVRNRDPKPEVERRMFALASVLRHDDYTVEDE